MIIIVAFTCTFKSSLFRHVICKLLKSVHSSYMLNTITVMYFLFNGNSSELWIFYLILLKCVYIKQILIKCCDSCLKIFNIWLFLIHLGTILKNIHFVLFEDFWRLGFILTDCLFKYSDQLYMLADLLQPIFWQD